MKQPLTPLRKLTSGWYVTRCNRFVICDLLQFPEREVPLTVSADALERIPADPSPQTRWSITDAQTGSGLTGDVGLAGTAFTTRRDALRALTAALALTPASR